jgi:hypothetical protein
MNSGSPRHTESVREALSWRGPFIVALLAVREFLRPVVYWHVWHIFENDVSRHIPKPYAIEEADVKLYSAEDGLPELAGQISALGELEREEAARRLAQGWLIAMAFVKEQPVGYMWIVLCGGMELAFDTYWIIGPGEALRYGSFVIPVFRGRAIHSSLNHAVACYLRDHKIYRALASISALNPQSMSLAKHNKRTIAMTVFIARIRGVNWTTRKSFGAPLHSRFTWPAR